MSDTKNKPYRVLARKYRPQNFDELIGQDALVRTLKNAITTGRIAHAFMLTGVRGVGKTTTARIIAKALNYKGPDGTAEATIGDTSDCPLCQAISEDRHPDVIEMDAASRTGVDDIREILDGVRYAPTEARFKIYVIDEVHMLSKNAFNALLKTLEEPPEHVKFIFATTEIRKVPITVLSRCQRFDLQRIGADLLIPHFKSICDKEKVNAEDEAIAMIARAADGSVRDGLSLLDQAIALSGDMITVQQMREMLGLTDRMQTFDLLEHALKGETAKALDVLNTIYKNGGEPCIVIQDMLELTHILTKCRAVPELEDAKYNISGDQLGRARTLAALLSMPTLSKTWQILLAGLNEVNAAPNPQNAAEMLVIRLTYAAHLPDPKDLIKKLKQGGASADTNPQATGAMKNQPSTVHAQDFTQAPQTGRARTNGNGQAIRTEAVAETMQTPALSIVPQAAPLQALKTIEDIIALLRKHEEYLLAEQLYLFAHLIKLEHKLHAEKPSGLLEFRPAEEAMPELSNNLREALKKITNHHWMIIVSQNRGAPTIAETDNIARLKELEEVAQIPMISKILEIFPEAELTKVTKTDPETMTTSVNKKDEHHA